MAVDPWWLRKTLSECVSRDPLRAVISVVHHDPEGQVVATNGHVMFVAQASELRLGAPVPGADYYPLALGDGKSRTRSAAPEAQPFPDWRKALPANPPKTVFRMVLPEWLSKIRVNSSYIRPCAIIGGPDPHLRLDGLASGALVTVDLRYLRPYALGGFPVCLGIHGPSLPLVLAADRVGVEQPLTAKWFGVVMPLREGSFGSGRTLEVAR